MPAKKSKAKRSVMRSLLISGFILALFGFSAWQFASQPRDGGGQPGFMRSLIDSLHDIMRPKPAGEVAPAAAVHVTQGAPAPALPEAKPVAQRPVAAMPKEAVAESKPSANPMASAKLEPAAPAAPPEASSDAARKAIDAVRAARNNEERTAAVAELQTAAQGGDAEAQFTLGRVYETGRGVKTDLSAARDWYTRAAGQGHVAAAFNLGMLEAQAGTREGYGHAARWFDQAARKGLADAQFNLGMLYAQGLGIGRDPVEAFAWFSAAAAQGDAGAAAERDRIGQALDEQARARGEALARERSPASKTDRG
jgi:localization factor PodJL